jgi:hypothetical protein
VSQSTVQILIAGMFCSFFTAAIYLLARRGSLTFQYAVGWLTLFVFGVVAVAILPATNKIAAWLRVTPSALVALSSLFVLLIICVQLSISISGLQHKIRRLCEECAQLRLELEMKDNNESVKE